MIKYDIKIMEGENMMDLTKSVQYIKGVGPAKAQLLEKIRGTYIRRFNYLLSKEL